MGNDCRIGGIYDRHILYLMTDGHSGAKTYPDAFSHIIRQMLIGQFYEKSLRSDYVFGRCGDDADAFSADEDFYDPADSGISDRWI